MHIDLLLYIVNEAIVFFTAVYFCTKCIPKVEVYLLEIVNQT